MSARDDNPNLHHIVVERDEEGPTSVRFVCDGDDSAPCHHWPDCGCESWGPWHYVEVQDQTIPYVDRTPLPSHENVPQPYCWIDPWFNETTSDWSDFTDLYDGPLSIDDSEVYGEAADWLVSGPVSVTFEGDYMTWEYAS